MTAARAKTQIITYRGNTQKDYISDSMRQATQAVNRLMRDGFVVDSVHLGSGGLPKIHILWHPRVADLGIERSVRRGNDGEIYERCLVDYDGCQVIWERK